MQPGLSRPPSLKDLLFAPIGCMLTASPFVMIGLVVVSLLVGTFAYYNWNVDLWGIGAPNFQSLIISPDYQTITNPDGSYLKISFEKSSDSVFAGLVRHVSPIREDKFPVLTHDILITSGDYADPQKVSTSVFNHHFFWQSGSQNSQGSINLLHTVPRDNSIYNLLLAVKTGQFVRITGREILRIDSYTASSTMDRWWTDTGCNSLVVDSVSFQK